MKITDLRSLFKEHIKPKHALVMFSGANSGLIDFQKSKNCTEKLHYQLVIWVKPRLFQDLSAVILNMFGAAFHREHSVRSLIGLSSRQRS